MAEARDQPGTPWLRLPELRRLLAGSPWAELDVRDTVDSTNLEARRRPTVWRVVAAGHQGAGRGRLARRWDSPAGRSLSVSCVLPVPVDRPQDWAWLPLLTAVAVRAALVDVAGVAAAVKWPNDVLARPGAVADGGWGKVAGILAEVIPPGGPGGPSLAVVGVGVNLGQAREELPVPTATSLALCGAGEVGVEALLARYLHELAGVVADWQAGGPALGAARAAYRGVCATVGAPVRVQLPDGTAVRGVAGAVDDAGRLVLRHAGGTSRYAVGDVEHASMALGPAAGSGAGTGTA